MSDFVPDLRGGPPTYDPVERETGGFDPSVLLGNLVGIFKRHILGLVIANAVALMLVYVGLTLVKPTYKSTTEILLVDPKAHIGVGDRGISTFDIDNTAINSEIELLRSTSIGVLVVKKLGLAADPEFVGAGVAASNRAVSPEDLATEVLAKHTDVQRVPFSYALTLSVVSEDPMKAQRITQTIADTFLSDQQTTRKEALQQLAEWWTGRVDQLRKQVVDTDSAIEKMRSELGLSVGSNPTLQKLASINGDPRTYMKLKELEPVAESQHKLYEAALVQLSEVTDRERYGATTARVITSATLPDHPGPKRKLFYPAAVIAATLIFLMVVWLMEKLRGGFTTPAAVEQATGHTVLGLIPIISDTESGSIDGQAHHEPVSEWRSRRFVDGIFALWPQYLSALFIKNTVFVPSQWRQLAGRAAEFMSSVAGGHGKKQAANHRQQTTAVTIEGLMRVILREPRGLLRDAVRAGQTIARLSGVPAAKVIAVVSSLPGEGKSATALLMATSSSMSGLRTVLLDCDPRRSSLSAAFGTNAFGSRSQYGRFQKDSCSGLTVFSVNPDILDNRADGATLRELITQLSAEYDYVVMDLPPLLGATADALYGAGLAHQIMLVVEWGRTSRSQVSEALRLLRFHHPLIAGVILNKVDYGQLPTYGVYGYGSSNGYSVPT